MNTQPKLDLPPGCAVIGNVATGFETILTREAMEFVVELARKFGPRVEELLARREVRQKEIDAGELPDFLPETRAIREREWHVTSIPADLQDRRVEITGPDRPQDDHQRAQLGREGVHGGLRRLDDAHLGQRRAGADQPARRRGAAHRVHEPGRQAVPAEPDDRHADRAAARLAPLREAHARRRQAGPGRVRRLRPLPLPQPRRAEAPGHRPVFLPAEDREPPRGAAVGRSVPARRGAPRPRAADDQGDAADRGDPRGLRDGRDPLGAARLHRRASTAAAGTTSSASSRSSAATRTWCCRTARRSR